MKIVKRLFAAVRQGDFEGVIAVTGRHNPNMLRPAVLTVIAACTTAAACVDEEQAAASCRMPFTEYSVGRSFDGIDFESRQTSCSKRPFVTYIYGTCHATSDTGCAPPLEVQTWSACHRKPSRAPAGHDIEMARGEVTVVIFATSDRLARGAQRALRKASPADRNLPLTRKLRACGAR